MRPLPVEIELPESFFQQETRCGYVVSAKMKRIWAVELDLLCKFDEVCRRHGIKYQLGFGTLLGAVRHKGFIPWDDDVDVWMKRKDFERLLEIANDFVYPYFLQTPLTDRKFLVLGARLRNSATTGVVAGMSSPDYNCGIYLDIYPMDGLIESQWRLFAQLIQKQVISKCMEIHRSTGAGAGIRRCWFPVLRQIVRTISYEKWNSCFNDVIAKYSGKVHRWTYINGWVWKNRKPYWLNECDINETIDGSFEKCTFPITRHFDAVLRRIYGSYMKFPENESLGAYHSGLVIFNPDESYRDYFEDNSLSRTETL